MTNVFGTNLVTVDGDDITTGQQDIVSTGDTRITTDTGPLTHGIFIVVKDSANYYVGAENVATTTGVKVSANNPLFIPIKDPSSLYCIHDGSGTKVISYIHY